MSKNKINVKSILTQNDLNISFKDTKQVLEANNNKAKYMLEKITELYENIKNLASKIQEFAEKNSDVTKEYVDYVKSELELQISGRQPNGNYALKEEIPTNISELNNDAEYVDKNTIDILEQSLKLPSQENCEGKFLSTNGTNAEWNNIVELENKLDLDFLNIGTTAKSLASEWSMPSNKSVNLTVGASGTEYIAPANGWLWFEGTTTGQAWFRLRGEGATFTTPYATTDGGVSGHIPARKGSKMSVYYGNIKNIYLKFYYAEGEV